MEGESMITREQIIAAARKADHGFGSHTLGGSVVGFDAVERFYAIAFEAGRMAEQEMCARIIEAQDVDPSFKNRMATAIRARGDTK